MYCCSINVNNVSNIPGMRSDDVVTKLLKIIRLAKMYTPEQCGTLTDFTELGGTSRWGIVISIGAASLQDTRELRDQLLLVGLNDVAIWEATPLSNTAAGSTLHGKIVEMQGAWQVLERDDAILILEPVPDWEIVTVELDGVSWRDMNQAAMLESKTPKLIAAGIQHGVVMRFEPINLVDWETKVTEWDKAGFYAIGTDMVSFYPSYRAYEKWLEENK